MMQDLLSRLAGLNRPRLLVRTARIGAQNYSRSRDLHRILGYGALPRPAAAATRLLELEAEFDSRRRRGGCTYDLAAHIDVLIALMGESELLRQPARDRQRPKQKTADP